MKIRVIVTALLLLALAAGTAVAGGTVVSYKLFHREGPSWIQYYPGDVFPPGGGSSGTNTWRYVYTLENVSSACAVNGLYVFFNGDGVTHATPPPTASGAPGGWTPSYLAPPAGQYAWRERFRGLGAPVPMGGSLTGYMVEFLWNDDVFPGVQSYDATCTTGSETGLTVAVRRTSPVAPGSWGQLHRLYR
ncbi:MAG: hypothetical protein HZB25_01005 [Candidatus Eisenbacteria bacterium]|nr:hypothetical protein [Candidatus Eisenbacteria bacterium]